MATTTAFSDYMENNIVRWSFRNTDMPSPPATVYVALFTTMPAEDGTGGVEVTTSGTAYTRQAVGCGTHNTGSGSGWVDVSSGNGQTHNISDILWAVATANYGTVVGMGIYDASTSGNLLYYGVANASVAINTNDQYKIAASSLTVTLD